MPSIEHNGVSIYFEEHGRGFPILTFAPAGLQSVIEAQRQVPLGKDEVASFELIRSTLTSNGPVYEVLNSFGLRPGP